MSFTEKKPRRCLKEDGVTEVFLNLTYQELFDRLWSDGGSMNWRIKLDDETDGYYLETVQPKFIHSAGTWPMASYAAGVSQSEVPAMREIDAKAGVPTEYTPGPDGGDPIFTSKRHRKEYMKAHQLYDRNAGYSDPAPIYR